MVAVPILVAFFFFLFIQTCYAENKTTCSPSSCGNIPNISHPLRLATDPKHCGDHSYTLYCENNTTILYLYSGKYYVKAINYNNYTIKLIDIGVQEEDCFSFPRFSLSAYNFSTGDAYTPYNITYSIGDGSTMGGNKISEGLAILSCTNPVLDSSFYVDISPCTNETTNPSVVHSYVYLLNLGYDEGVFYLHEGCKIKQFIMVPNEDYSFKNWSSIGFHGKVLNGFELYWYNVFCPHCRNGFCGLNAGQQIQCFGRAPRVICDFDYYIFDINDDGDACIFYDPEDVNDIGHLILAYVKAIGESRISILALIGVIIGGKFVCGSPFVVGVLIYKWRRRHLSEYDRIEEFLQNNNNLMPIRYSYSNIKKITKNFKHKLGEGGFGSVYKGQLRSGQFAAVKILGKSGSNGQDFVNEVATIGVIHHVNVVQLIGFCVEGSKCALVFEFMTNGSLEKYIFPREGSIPLSRTKLLDISLGVARGTEYLHRGCGKQILHFDIKPHNILLDENFIPKLSDFGLSKLYNANQSIVSLTAVRGTIGYMAPELCFKNIGNVSYKADVYSFGMLLLEMACQTKIWKSTMAENSSQNYFPIWAHDQISNGNDIEIGCESEEENLIAKKMIIVGLWCIQMQPDNRPSMKKVVEMLEGDLNNLQLPPKPLIYPEVTVSRDEIGASSSSVCTDVTESTSLMKSFDLECGVA